VFLPTLIRSTPTASTRRAWHGALLQLPPLGFLGLQYIPLFVQGFLSIRILNVRMLGKRASVKCLRGTAMAKAASNSYLDAPYSDRVHMGAQEGGQPVILESWLSIKALNY